MPQRRELQPADQWQVVVEPAGAATLAALIDCLSDPDAREPGRPGEPGGPGGPAEPARQGRDPGPGGGAG